MPESSSLSVPGFLEKSTLRTKRQLMTYVTAAFFSFTFTLLAASIALFLRDRFIENPNAIFWVGAILGMASMSALFIDPFWAYLQRIRKPRFLFFLALGGLLCTISIFLFSGIFPFFGWTIFTIVAALLYGWSYDLYDVTILTTLLRNGKKERYAQEISQKKFAEAVGMLFGLMLSGFLLFFGSFFTQIILTLMVLGVFLFAAQHFDRSEDEEIALHFSPKSLIPWSTVFSLLGHPQEIERLLGKAGEHLKAEIILLSQETEAAIRKFPKNATLLTTAALERGRKKLIEILAREEEIVKSYFPEKEFHFREMLQESIHILKEFIHIFAHHTNLLLLWVTLVIIFFSFWDTMAVTFQPLFLEHISGEGSSLRLLSGVIMASFLVPILLFQMPFAALADRWGRSFFIVSGICISGSSLLFLGTAENISAIFLAGLGNSLGYALAFVPAQALLIDEIQRKAQGSLSEMGQEKSAGLLRVALNMGNVLGQFGGGIIFALLGFSTGFFAFGILLLLFGIFSLFVLFRSDKEKE